MEVPEPQAPYHLEDDLPRLEAALAAGPKHL
jgi:hypothetical protein